METRPPAERFWPKVDKHGPMRSPYLGPCWVWTAAVAWTGYGIFGRPKGGKIYAHRFAYELMHGPIPDGLDLDHLCRVKGCVNPAHLEPVTRRENLMRSDSVVARFAQRDHCSRGHAYTEENTRVTKEGRACRACHRHWAKEAVRRKEQAGAEEARPRHVSHYREVGE